MGFDYYIICDLVINLDNLESRILQFSREGQYSYISSWDSDYEDDYDKQFSLELENVEKREQKKDKLLYNNGNWLITAESKIDQYIDLIKKNNISFEQIKSIEKKFHVMERY